MTQLELILAQNKLNENHSHSFCPKCGSHRQILELCERSSPHYAAIRCADCGRWLKWAKKPSNMKNGGLR